MDQLSSKSHKKENKTDILLYQIYLPKLHENIWKYYRLNLFKDIVTTFNYNLQETSKSPANLSNVSLV